MATYFIRESEYKFMLILWDCAPIRSGELVKLCKEQLGWKKPTTYTVIRNLCRRGVIKNEDAVVSFIAVKDEVQYQKSEEILENGFEGSLPIFLTSFLRGKKLTEEEANELHEIINRYMNK